MNLLTALRNVDTASPRYRWIALSNTTLGMLMATINGSSVIIALPAIFRGIHLDPLDPANVGYLLWILMGYLLVTAVLVVTFGRLGDMLGRVRMYNLGFALFTLASILLSLVWSTGAAGGMELVLGRVVQGIGGSLLMANSIAILTDAFPPDKRGMAMGVNQVAGISGMFIGLIAGGLLAEIDWRWVFLINVPIGLLGTVWAYLMLKELGVRSEVSLDPWGNLTFAGGMVTLLIAITYGIMPYGGHTMGWTNPLVDALLAAGVVLLAAFVWVENRVANPMFHLELFRIRAFTAGNLAGLLSAIGRGGLQFMLIIWLQGIWLPLHGYNFVDTPLWAGIYMIPLTVGFLLSGPVSGWLSDRFGARPFATGGMLVSAAMFGLLMTLPANFGYPFFAALLFLMGCGFGLFSAPNTTGIMNSVPPDQRGAASGMRSTFQNAGTVLSIGMFFSLMIAGLATTLPSALRAGLQAHHVPAAIAAKIASLPPVGSLFAAFLGYNPMKSMLGHRVLAHLSRADARALTGNSYFPHLIAGPFMHGLTVVFTFGIVMCVIAAAASWMRGKRYIHEQHGVQRDREEAERRPAPVGG